MKSLLESPWRITGLVITFLSSIIFFFPQFAQMPIRDFWSFFTIHYIMVAGYGIAYIIRFMFIHKWNISKIDSAESYLLLILSMISAWALNRDMPVFNESVEWLTALLFVMGIVGVLYSFFKKTNPIFNSVHSAILGLAIPVLLYFSIYLLPIYPISAIGLFFFGISIHSFVPAFYLIFAVLELRKLFFLQASNKWVFSAVCIVMISYTAIFSYQWRQRTLLIDETYSRELVQNSDLPSWVRIAQKIPKSELSKKTLVGSDLYTIPSETRRDEFGLPRTSLNEVRKHDPLVFIASLITPPHQLSLKEKHSIMNCLYDGRHLTQEKLWRGTNLETKNVINHINFWPEYRMAYTEKIITVKNEARRNSWLNQQEALYTFHLPEGAVVTSLSLWIEGEEQPGFLTTKQKADSAYKTIVGRERRDPSLVHWQEGNTVAVRVFPVIAKESRRFKIGITSPLKVDGEELKYQNTWFEGPEAANARELRIFKSNHEFISMGFETEMNENGKREYSGSYQSDWSCVLQKHEIIESNFTYNGYSYKMIEPTKFPISFSPKEVYLDINASWTEQDVANVLRLTTNYETFVMMNNKVSIDLDNYKEQFGLLKKHNFSLFPFYKISDPFRTLVVTKSVNKSPNLNDLVNTDFYQKLDTKTKYFVFNIGGPLETPYLRSLKEFRVIKTCTGNMEELENILQSKLFPDYLENNNLSVIEPSQIALLKIRTNDSSKTKAPDHFFRLFAYNHIMQNAGIQSIQKDYSDSSLVSLAEKAYVVSPLSSLIVLETQKDYDRFDIKKSKDSLGNADMHNDGSVPEPHEWMLIIVIGIAIITLTAKRIL